MVKLFSWGKEVRKDKNVGFSKTFTFERGKKPEDAAPQPVSEAEASEGSDEQA